MALTNAQLVTLKAAMLAETDPEFVGYRDGRNDTAATAWLNQNSTQDAWMESVAKSALFEATDVAKFDNLTAGKRAAWELMLDNAPIDAARNKIRKAVEDVWGVTDSVAVLQAMVRKATRAEQYLGGNSATSNTVTAWKLNFTGFVTTEDVGRAYSAS